MVFRFFVALSILLFLATAVSFVAAYFGRDTFIYRNKVGTYDLISSQSHGILFERADAWPDVLTKPDNGFGSIWPFRLGGAGAGFSFVHDSQWLTEHEAAGWAIPSTSFNHFLSPMGFWFGTGNDHGTMTWSINVPRWFLFLLSSAFPCVALFRVTRQWRIKRSRTNRGLCQKCSYDLRAHAAGDACPECGTAIPQQTAVNTTFK